MHISSRPNRGYGISAGPNGEPSCLGAQTTNAQTYQCHYQLRHIGKVYNIMAQMATISFAREAQYDGYDDGYDGYDELAGAVQPGPILF